MEDLPKRHSKVVRIRLADRLGLPALTHRTRYSQLHWEALGAKSEADLTEKLPSRPCMVEEADVSRAISSVLPLGVRSHVQHNQESGVLEAYLAPAADSDNTKTVQPDRSLIDRLRADMPKLVDGFLVPHRYFLLDEPIQLDVSNAFSGEALMFASQAKDANTEDENVTTAGRVTRIFATLLACPLTEVPGEMDFFALGGDSLSAGKLLSALRSEFGVSPPVDLVFRDGSVNSLATFIETKLSALPKEESYDTANPSQPAQDPRKKSLPQIETCSSTNPFLLVLQLIPIVILYPVRRGIQWTIFLVALADTRAWSTTNFVAGRLVNVVACIFFTRILVRAVAPFVGILAKWVIIGRYREGVYPMWGLYHTRWWMVQKIVDIFDIGIYA